MNEIKHGIDSWGLEMFDRETVRDEENGRVVEYGRYVYEKTKPFEQRVVTRVLSSRRGWRERCGE